MKVQPTILHHKYSLADGHVTAQISKIKGYRGLVVTTASNQKRDKTPFKNVLTLKEIKKNPNILKELRVAGVHVHHGNLASKFRFFKEKYHIPLFVGFRGKDATAFPKSKENLKQLKKLFKTADLFFPVCNHLKQEIIRLGCPAHKIRVLYGGVDLGRFDYQPRILKPNKSVRFLAIGRFVEKKGFSDLIRAFAKVKKVYPKVKLKLVGQGPCEKEYRRLIKKLKLGNSVQIISWVDYRKIQKRYYRSHIFCAPSCTDRSGNQEGIPNTLKEAMATGMPVISTTHAGIPELIEHKVSGLLVPENSVRKLTKAMLRLAMHPEEWNTLGENARKTIENNFNLELQLEKQKRYYEEIIST